MGPHEYRFDLVVYGTFMDDAFAVLRALDGLPLNSITIIHTQIILNAHAPLTAEQQQTISDACAAIMARSKEHKLAVRVARQDTDNPNRPVREISPEEMAADEALLKRASEAVAAC